MGACIAHTNGQRFACVFQFPREIFMGARNGLFEQLCIGCDSFTLRGQTFKQSAKPALVLRISALDIGHFGAHYRFQFAGAGQSALNPITHVGDFATNGL